jgi:hypothetical protein
MAPSPPTWSWAPAFSSAPQPYHGCRPPLPSTPAPLLSVRRRSSSSPMAPPAFPCPPLGSFNRRGTSLVNRRPTPSSWAPTAWMPSPFFHLWPTPCATPLSTRPAAVASKFPAPSFSSHEQQPQRLRATRCFVLHSE